MVNSGNTGLASIEAGCWITHGGNKIDFKLHKELHDITVGYGDTMMVPDLATRDKIFLMNPIAVMAITWLSPFQYHKLCHYWIGLCTGSLCPQCIRMKYVKHYHYKMHFIIVHSFFLIWHHRELVCFINQLGLLWTISMIKKKKKITKTGICFSADTLRCLFSTETEETGLQLLSCRDCTQDKWQP